MRPSFTPIAQVLIDGDPLRKNIVEAALGTRLPGSAKSLCRANQYSLCLTGFLFASRGNLISVYRKPSARRTDGATLDVQSIALPKGRLGIKLVCASNQHSRPNPGRGAYLANLQALTAISPTGKHCSVLRCLLSNIPSVPGLWCIPLRLFGAPWA